jgi:hypothetical protein
MSTVRGNCIGSFSKIFNDVYGGEMEIIRDKIAGPLSFFFQDDLGSFPKP